MFEVRVAGGASDGKILGEFSSFEDAEDMMDGYNNHYIGVDGEAVIVDQADQEGVIK